MIQSSAEERSLLLFAEDLYNSEFERDYATAWLALRNVLPFLDLKGEVTFRGVISRCASALEEQAVDSKHNDALQAQAEYYRATMERLTTGSDQLAASFSLHLTLSLLESLAENSPHAIQFGEFFKAQNQKEQEGASLQKRYPAGSRPIDVLFDRFLEKYMSFSHKAAAKMIARVLFPKISFLDPKKPPFFSTRHADWSIYLFLEVEAVRALRSELQGIFETKKPRAPKGERCFESKQQAWQESLELFDRTQHLFADQKKLVYTLDFLRRVGPDALWEYAQANPNFGLIIVQKSTANNLAEDFFVSMAARLYREATTHREAVDEALRGVVPGALGISLNQPFPVIISAYEQSQSLMESK